MKGKKRRFRPWKSQELPKIGCGPSQGEHSQGLLGQRQHWEGAAVSQSLLPCSSARGQLHHIPWQGQSSRGPCGTVKGSMAQVV